jgi:UDP-glucose 4-epimerase
MAARYADLGKALWELGWRTRRDLSDMCASVWKFQNRDT